MERLNEQNAEKEQAIIRLDEQMERLEQERGEVQKEVDDRLVLHRQVKLEMTENTNKVSVVAREKGELESEISRLKLENSNIKTQTQKQEFAIDRVKAQINEQRNYLNENVKLEAENIGYQKHMTTIKSHINFFETENLKVSKAIELKRASRFDESLLRNTAEVREVREVREMKDEDRVRQMPTLQERKELIERSIQMIER